MLEEVEDFYEPEQRTCLACDGILRTFSLLVCAECLGDGCDQFLDLVDDEEETPTH